MVLMSRVDDTLKGPIFILRTQWPRAYHVELELVELSLHLRQDNVRTYYT